MPQPNCRHVLASGVQCQAAPLRNRDYCRFHPQQFGRRMRAARARARHQRPALKLPLLEDLYSVQIALMQLADAIAYQEIDPPQARLLTSVLRLAMQNLKSRQPWEESARFQMAAGHEAAVTEWETFEQEHDLPAGADLSVDPEVAFPPQPEIAAEAANGNDARSGNATAESSGPRLAPFEHFDWGANMSEFLRDAAVAPPALVTADDVELYDVYEREGDEGVSKCVAQLERSRKRRERYARRLFYEQVARNRSIQLGAQRLAAEQHKAEAATAKAQASAEPLPSQEASNPSVQGEVEAGRKPPQSEAAQSTRKIAVANA